MNDMKKRRVILAVVCAVTVLLTGMLLWNSFRDKSPVAKDNAANFGALLTDLVNACEDLGPGDEAAIEADLATIRAVSRRDFETAESIVSHWQRVFLDQDYQLILTPEDIKPVLADAGITDGTGHAIVVLGYELKDGEMQPELQGRCQAAATLAEMIPSTILVCSGGATGDNNPENHTEAGLMKSYLMELGVDGSRIFIDEDAMTTQENAVNTFRILREQKIRTMTIVTSTYHQCRGQAVYNAVGALYRKQYGYSAEIVGNYCFDTEPVSEMNNAGDRIAAFQIAGILELPEDVMRTLPSFFPARPQKDAQAPAA